ncbi:type 2 periplasmic-binding domain-containing protein [Paenibacillus sp. JNUCC31]|uniref:transporter substrate-binding domain-containing protein n=1 Tax=Paenibacillus sp. JNUCC-31 TaxID=2777983 RepID=UPI00225E14A4|nr:transporter substrate-binding domain-containing protein [Paenibacillus sp. JNUCC-31]
MSGKQVGVQKSSIQEGIAQDIQGAKLTSLAKIPELILELQTGRVDALILEKPVAQQSWHDTSLHYTATGVSEYAPSYR